MNSETEKVRDLIVFYVISTVACVRIYNYV